MKIGPLMPKLSKEKQWPPIFLTHEVDISEARLTACQQHVISWAIRLRELTGVYQSRDGMVTRFNPKFQESG